MQFLAVCKKKNEINQNIQTYAVALPLYYFIVLRKINQQMIHYTVTALLV